MTKRIPVFIFILLCSCFLLLGCAGNKDDREVVILAASSLTDAVGELEREYEAQHPDVDLTVSFASSGKLRQQIEQGAPADLFLSAGKQEMDRLEKQGRILSSTRTELLSNQLVLIVPEKQGREVYPVKHLRDLYPDKVDKLAIGEPETVPAGRYAKEYLIRSHRWDKLHPKMILAGNVRQVLTYVESGNVDAGLVYQSDVQQANVKMVDTVPSQFHSPIVYVAAIVESADNPQQARSVLRWLKGSRGKDVFEKHGFKGVPAE
ncbi:molybdate ABC transporter substrate-binding protein [Melghirimyces algeriensis]|uniref:Molybdate transport system substrate-binding protein n=1 Tax=Melghirimyces algeriensis TaxID=910412 RepID=A0A521E1C4_9BACL|nr:molybdate ABC transporter substrate-binding protein [Melghirimyces algeriensis]SMO77754.1 molybdate transport system substrate-binding protein [Melghirimyces algeriensis]